MASDPPSKNLRRGTRQIRPSLRALEADLEINEASERASSSIDPLLLAKPSAVAARKSSTPKSAPNLPLNQRAVTMDQPISPCDVADSIEPQNYGRPQQPSRGTVAPAVTVADRVTKHQRKSRKPSASKKARGSAQHQKKTSSLMRHSIQDFKTKDPQLQPAKLAIYIWEYPRPTNFLNLSESRKAWKAAIDAEQGLDDLDPELDDWHEFCGVVSDIVSELPLKSSIALNFASRAKRAFRAGRSWESFEQEELSINSEAGVKATKDPYERKIALETVLDNELRLYVFEEIKVRLCHEIWLQPYPEPDTSSNDGERVVQKKDSVISTAATTPNPASTDQKGTASFSEQPAALKLSDGETSKQVRTRPELPGGDRELHQPQGPRIRATQRNMRGLGIS